MAQDCDYCGDTLVEDDREGDLCGDCAAFGRPMDPCNCVSCRDA